MIKLTLAMLQNITILATICLSIPTFGFKISPNVDELVANQRPRMRQYTNTYHAELQALRNYILLLSNSNKSRTPTGGNNKVKKYDLAEYKDVPCTCEQQGKETKILGEDYFPPAIETRVCDVRLCPTPYGCKERFHNITVLKRRRYIGEPSQEVLPEYIEKRWIAIKEPVVVGCMCLKEY